jgi:hypothetical protein
MSKAFWQIFVLIQKEVWTATREFAGVEERRELTEEEQILSVEGIKGLRNYGDRVD